MRKGSCLFARLDNGEEAVLFEGGNRIPLFWLTLLGQEDIDRFCEQLRLPPAGGAEQCGCRFELDKLRALIRAADRRNYVALYHAPCLSLFDDWLFFMQTADFCGQKIYLDPNEISACYETPERFVESLRKAVTSLDENRETWYESTIAATCGFESRNRFERRFGDYSEAFRRMSRNTVYSRFDNKIHLEKKRSVGKKILRAICIILLAALLAAAVFFFRT
ncbi:MAG: hypothetical protein LBP50_01085 [Tannerella sp.]|jgi:hypothetical protein|nr:hypothetical protein [Tannerella sp.]